MHEVQRREEEEEERLNKNHLRGFCYDFVSGRVSVLHRYELTKRTLVLLENWPDLSSVSDLGLSTSGIGRGIGTSFAHYTIQLRGNGLRYGNNHSPSVHAISSIRRQRVPMGAPGCLRLVEVGRSFLDSSTVTVPQLLNRSSSIRARLRRSNFRTGPHFRRVTS